MSGKNLTGGCQCGAVRYRIDREPHNPQLCHCRMCQRALGAPFGAYFSIARDAVTWTGEAPVEWNSSNVAARGFCWTCGTPISFSYHGADHISLTIPSLDDPEAVTPKESLNRESGLEWVDRISELENTPPHPDTETISSNQPVFLNQKEPEKPD